VIDNVLTENGLNSEDLDKFKTKLKQSNFKKGSYFISSGQISRYIAFIEKGYLRTYHLDENGNEITTEFNQPGTFCGSYYSFYAQQSSFEYIEAITDCELFLLSFNSLQNLYAHSFSMNVFGRTILEKACIERDLRLKKIMHLTAAEKYKWFLKNYPEVYKVAKLGHIASFLGIKPETLSRARRKIIS
jgi:CRP-like cAMP-binding protein